MKEKTKLKSTYLQNFLSAKITRLWNRSKSNLHLPVCSYPQYLSDFKLISNSPANYEVFHVSPCLICFQLCLSLWAVKDFSRVEWRSHALCRMRHRIPNMSSVQNERWTLCGKALLYLLVISSSHIRHRIVLPLFGQRRRGLTRGVSFLTKSLLTLFSLFA